MAEQCIDLFHNKHSKHSDAEIIALTVKILSAIESCGCNHCEKILTEVYRINKMGVGLNHEATNPKPSGQMGICNGFTVSENANGINR